MTATRFIPRRALLSVADKREIVALATTLHRHGIELVATGNTAAVLKSHHLPVTDVSACTGFPEMLNGRVKTLHPAIHAGLLANGADDEKTLHAFNIQAFDLLVVNLYPFENIIQEATCTFAQAIEHIDIGGPAMIRAAAKNHANIAVVVSPDDYPLLQQYLDDQQTADDWQLALAKKAFAYTARYDAAIANYLHQQADHFPAQLTRQYQKQYDLRYGENPQQQAALYALPDAPANSLAQATRVQGRQLSYNNLLDADAAMSCGQLFSDDDQVCVIVKHGNPCGIAARESQLDAYLRAYASDPSASYGGILAFNHVLDGETASAIIAKQFVDVIIAPAISAEARAILAQKENIRVLATGKYNEQVTPQLEMKSINGGLLIQQIDQVTVAAEQLHVVTTRLPNAQQMRDLIFAWQAVKPVKSNAIVFATDQATIGIGAGQTSRIMSARIGLWQAQSSGFPTQGAVMASDAFIPFADTIQLAAQHGITAVIQPGGSMRDKEVIAVANDLEMVMVFTGYRHFKH